MVRQWFRSGVCQTSPWEKARAAGPEGAVAPVVDQVTVVAGVRLQVLLLHGLEVSFRSRSRRSFKQFDCSRASVRFNRIPASKKKTCRKSFLKLIRTRG